MNDLGPEVRSMLDAARGAEPPTRADRQRIKHAVLLRAATLGAVSTASMAAGGAAAMSVATKVTVAALTVAVLGGGSVSLWALKEHVPPAAPTRVVQPRTARRVPPAPPIRPVAAVEAVVPEAPAVEAPAVEAPAIVEEPRPKPLPPEVRRREGVRSEVRRSEPESVPVAESAPVIESTPRLDSLDRELTALRQAQEDLRAGLFAQALRRLAEYDRRFGNGPLEQERRAIEAIALCRLHPGPASRAQAERFLRAAPLSPLAERVRSACKKSDEPAGSPNGIEPDREASKHN
jgi:hypothetical protein